VRSIAAEADEVEVPAGYPGLGWREEVARIDAQVRKLRERQRRVVGQALAAGVTLSEIGRAFGMSRQSAHHRFGDLRVRVVPPVTPGASPRPAGGALGPGAEGD
jgi:DNA-directed RNA polymerase specialized sigma24 family protein